MHMTMFEDPKDNALSFLKMIAGKYKIFIDTCSLLDENFTAFFQNFSPFLQENKNVAIVPHRVLGELKKLQTPRGNDASAIALTTRAFEVERLLASLQPINLITIRGEETDNFADNVFLTVFTKFRLSHDLLLITQDRDLAGDILKLNDSKSNLGHKILVVRINKYAMLSQNQPRTATFGAHTKVSYASRVRADFESSPASSRQISSSREETDAVYENDKRPDCFALPSKVTTQQDEILQISHLPGEGDSVKNLLTGGETRLLKSLAAGGEGTIYLTPNPEVVCKIYHPKNLTLFRLEKLNLMLNKKVVYPGVCWPKDIVMNREDKPVGYLMPRAQGEPLQHCVFIKPLLEKKFPDWTRRDTVELCLTILKKINYLHSFNIILGDINPQNILVKSPSDVYFVDTDSYQIEGYPCGVGTIIFTAPEIQGRSFSAFLRTLGHERFAVSTLLFMIMLPGKPPYSSQGGEGLIENIKKMDFAYPSGPKSNKKTPDGPWRFCWSHMPRYLKDDFYDTFNKDGQYATEDKRLSSSDWIKKFAEYRYLLESGKLLRQDEMAGRIFPNRYKLPSGVESEKCRLCNISYPEDMLQDGICQDCLKNGEAYTCSVCGAEMIFTNYAKLIKKAKRHTLCQKCYATQNEIYEERHCIDCQKNFPITVGEANAMREKSFELPKRCPECREAKKSFAGHFSNNNAKDAASKAAGNDLFANMANFGRLLSNLFK